MKSIILFILSSLALFSCKVNEPAEFKRIGNLRVESITQGNVVLLADAQYYNPNHLGGKVASVDIDVLFDGEKVAKVDAIKGFSVPKQDKFSIPLRVSIPLKELSKNEGLLGGVLNAVLDKQVAVDFDGTMKFDFKVMKYTYKINETQQFSLSK